MPIKQKLTDAFSALRNRRDANQKAMRDNLRDYIKDAAAARIAGKSFELDEPAIGVLESLLFSENLTLDDFESNITAHVQRIKDAEMAAKVPSLASEANRLGEQVQKFQQELWIQHEANLKLLNEMDFAAVAARTKLYASVTAESNLQAQGEVSDAEKALAEEGRVVADKIAKLKSRFTKARPWWFSSNAAASAVEFPVLAIAESEREITSRKRSSSPNADVNIDGIKRCERTITKAREVIASTEAEIKRFEKQLTVIDAKLRDLAANRQFEILKPKRAMAHA